MNSSLKRVFIEEEMRQPSADINREISRIFDDIIRQRQLFGHFQPIVDLQSGEIIGYESLIRGPSDSFLHPPNVLFETAIRLKRLVELETLCRDIHIENFARLKLRGKLFLNISPVALLEPDFPRGFTKQSLKKHGLACDRLVIELTEDFPIFDIDAVRASLQYYRSEGFKVALDDLGTAYAGLRLWSELKPEYIKFDKYFIQSINTDPHKKQLIQNLQDIAEHTGCLTIAEGVETVEEYYTVQSLGLTYGQGYYFSRPSATPPASLPNDILLQPRNSLPENYEWGTKDVSCLLKSMPTVPSSLTLVKAGELLQKYPTLSSLPVVDDEIAMGVLHRRNVWDELVSRFGRELFGKNTIASLNLIDRKALRIEIDVAIEQLSQMITSESRDEPGDLFIITENGRYRGVGRVVDLLKEITEMQIRNARYANPLTLLPGNVPIEKKLEYLLTKKIEFTVCYFDLDNFKPFNDTYGYCRGDMAIRLTGTIIKESCDPKKDFIGHVGGDDFIAIFCSRNWQDRCQRILERFAQEIPGLYDEAHRQNGSIEAQDRQGNFITYAFISLSIGATTYYGDEADPGHKHISHHDISSQAAEAKKPENRIKRTLFGTYPQVLQEQPVSSH